MSPASARFPLALKHYPPYSFGGQARLFARIPIPPRLLPSHGFGGQARLFRLHAFTSLRLSSSRLYVFTRFPRTALHSVRSGFSPANAAAVA